MIARTKHNGPLIDARIALGSDRDSLVSFNMTWYGRDINNQNIVSKVDQGSSDR